MSQQPWVEIYRPRSLDEVIGQENIIERLKIFVAEQQMPHLIFAGPAGTGKTTSALALIRDLFGKKMKRSVNFLELNASDARGIEVVRTYIKDFAKAQANPDIPFKILILDEADNMTASAMQALRRTMEKYTQNCRFILICNYSNKIILPIQSRCAIFRFSPLTNTAIKNRVQEIAKKESVQLTDEGLETLIYVSQGDCRRAVNYLQSCATLDVPITEEIVLKITGKIHPDEIQKMLYFALNHQLSEAKDCLYTFIEDYGLSGRNIVSQAHTEVYNLNEGKVTEEQKFQIIKILAEIEYRLSQGGTEEVQLNAMLAKISLLQE